MVYTAGRSAAHSIGVALLLWLTSGSALALDQWSWQVAAAGVTVPGNFFNTHAEALAAMRTHVSFAELLIEEQITGLTETSITYKYTALPVEARPLSEWQYRLFLTGGSTFDETEAIQSMMEWADQVPECPDPRIVSVGEWVTGSDFWGIPTVQSKTYKIETYIQGNQTNPCPSKSIGDYHLVRQRSVGCPTPYFPDSDSTMRLRTRCGNPRPALAV